MNENREQAIKDVKLYLANDWNLKGETPEYFIIKKNEATLTGHVVVFILTFLFTFGLGNVLYHFAKRRIKKIIK
jgi:hypothetical protein